MSRYDKYEPKAGGFRAPLAADQTALDGPAGDAAAPIGVALDANGAAVPLGNVGAQTGLVGILLTTRDLVAGEIVDVMTSGEIVEWGGAAGTDYYVTPSDGSITSNPDVDGVGTGIGIGHTVEAGRLIVRV